MNRDDSPIEAPYTSMNAIVLRLFWLLIGNFALGISAMLIVQNHNRTLSGADVVFGLVVPLLILSRYVDIRFYNGATPYGLPATMQDWRRYSLSLAGISLIIWLAAHGIAFLLAN